MVLLPGRILLLRFPDNMKENRLFWIQEPNEDDDEKIVEECNHLFERIEAPLVPTKRSRSVSFSLDGEYGDNSELEILSKKLCESLAHIDPANIHIEIQHVGPDDQLNSSGESDDGIIESYELGDILSGGLFRQTNEEVNNEAEVINEQVNNEVVSEKSEEVNNEVNDELNQTAENIATTAADILNNPQLTMAPKPNKRKRGDADTAADDDTATIDTHADTINENTKKVKLTNEINEKENNIVDIVNQEENQNNDKNGKTKMVADNLEKNKDKMVDNKTKTTEDGIDVNNEKIKKEDDKNSTENQAKMD